jgi:hypothetical protein
LLAHGRWFSSGTPASSTTKTGRHDIAEILLRVVLKHQKSNQFLPTKEKFKDRCNMADNFPTMPDIQITENGVAKLPHNLNPYKALSGGMLLLSDLLYLIYDQKRFMQFWLAFWLSVCGVTIPSIICLSYL